MHVPNPGLDEVNKPCDPYCFCGVPDVRNSIQHTESIGDRLPTLAYPLQYQILCLPSDPSLLALRQMDRGFRGTNTYLVPRIASLGIKDVISERASRQLCEY
jgi:hypothetical protein